MTYTSFMTAVLFAVVALVISYGIVSIVKLTIFFNRKRKISKCVKELTGEYASEVLWRDINAISFAVGSTNNKIFFNIILQPDDFHCLLYAEGRFFGTVTARNAASNITRIADAIWKARENKTISEGNKDDN